MTNELKAYVMDHGWSGAEIVFAESREEAAKILIDPCIRNLERMKKEHDEHYFDPKSPLYDPTRQNPNDLRIEHYTKGRLTLIDEYEIKKGVIIETVGDN